MNSSVTGIDTLRKSLSELMAECNEKEVRRAVVTAGRRAATDLKRTAIRYFKASSPKWGHAAEVARGYNRKGFRSGVTRDKDGIYVTIRPNGAKDLGMHRNSRGLLKPILFWANVGVDRTRGHKVEYRQKAGIRYKKKGKATPNRGRIPAAGFMEKTAREGLPKASEAMAKAFRTKIENTVSKHMKQ